MHPSAAPEEAVPESMSRRNSGSSGWHRSSAGRGALPPAAARDLLALERQEPAGAGQQNPLGQPDDGPGRRSTPFAPFAPSPATVAECKKSPAISSPTWNSETPVRPASTQAQLSEKHTLLGAIQNACASASAVTFGVVCANRSFEKAFKRKKRE